MSYLWAPDDSYRDGFVIAKDTIARVVSESAPGVPPDKGEALYVAARYGPEEGRIVEIGSAFGRSTIYLAAGAKAANREKVWSIDPHTEYNSGEAFLRNIREAGLEKWVVALVCTSEQAHQDWDGSPVRLLFVDNGHSHSEVRDDIDRWVPLVNGLIIWDDYGSHSGVALAVDEFCYAEGYERTLCGDMAWIEVKGVRNE